MARDVVIGIDPGSKGYMTVYNNRTNSYEYIPLVDTGSIIDTLSELKDVNAIVCIEHVKAIHGSGATATFNFGKSVGIIMGIVIALRLPLCEVSPQKWQKEMWESQDKISSDGKVNTKQTSLRCAKRLHPNIDFRRTDRCTKPDDNKVDSTLICDYAIRKNL